MQLKIQKYLFDIQTSITSIYEYIGEKRNFKDYKKSKLLRRGVDWELEIIGEAASQILKIDANIEIDNARKIVDLRNLVIHSYDSVDDIIIWGIINNHLPLLKAQVEKLLS